MAANKQPQLFSCSFEVTGKVPKDVYNKFVEVQANLLGLCGWIQEVSEGKYKGYIEGEMPKMEEIKKVIEHADKFAALVQKVTFEEFKKIEKRTQQNFQVK